MSSFAERKPAMGNSDIYGVVLTRKEEES